MTRPAASSPSATSPPPSSPRTATTRAVDGVSFDVGAGETLGHRRRIRLRQERDGAVDHAPPAGAPRPHRPRQRRLRGPRPPRPRRERDASDPRQPHRDDLPGADDEPQSGAHDRPPDRRIGAHPRGRLAGRGAGARRLDAEPRAHPGRRAPARRLPAPVLRRHAPAGHDRHGARLQPAPAHRRRADDGARRDDPGADPQADARAQGAHRLGRDPHHPRSRRRRRDLPARHRDVCRTQDRGGADPRAVRPPGPPLHPRPDGLDPALRRRARPQAAPGRDSRHRAQLARADRGLRLRAALPLRGGALSRRGPASAAGRRRPRRSLPFRRGGDDAKGCSQRDHPASRDAKEPLSRTGEGSRHEVSGSRGRWTSRSTSRSSAGSCAAPSRR